MRAKIILILCLAAANVFAYEKTVFHPCLEIGYPIILFSKENSAEKAEGLRYSGPRLDGSWKEFSFVFTSHGDGTVCLRLGPPGSSGIPFYYSDIRANGVPLDARSWIFKPPRNEGVRIGSMVDGPEGQPCLKIYFEDGAWYFLRVQAGVRIEVTMRGRAGSVLEAYSDQLADVTASLDEALKTGPNLRGDALASGQELAQCLNELVALSGRQLKITVEPIGPLSLDSLKAKVLELSKACASEAAREPATLCLYDQPEIRAEIKAKITQAACLAAKLKTDCLLSFMLPGQEKNHRQN